jgi:hypothetical protein
VIEIEFKIPKSLKVEHEELQEELAKATKENGKIGDAAKAVAKILRPHFEEHKAIVAALEALTYAARKRRRLNILGLLKN